MNGARPKVAIIGSGPAGLMAASQALREGADVFVFERRKGLGRKLLIAGSSGLNVSYDAPIDDFLEFYRKRDSSTSERLIPLIKEYPPEKWLAFLRSLDQEVFVGTSRRWFVREMKASKLLSDWTHAIKRQGGQFYPQSELIDFASTPRPRIEVRKDSGDTLQFEFDAVIFTLGGGSWESPPPVWPEIFTKKNISVTPFHPSNVGYEVAFTDAFLREAEGKPIKNCVLKTRLGEKQGELIITRYGLEGTPVYFMGTPGLAKLNLRPGIEPEEFLRELSRPLRENLSPLRRLKKLGGLSEAALALIFHLLPEENRKTVHDNLSQLASIAQDFPIHLTKPRPLEEAISSKGGLRWEELEPSLMIRNFPGFFAAGEMIDWDAPTGGFLIQASVALGSHAGIHAVHWARSRSSP